MNVVKLLNEARIIVLLNKKQMTRKDKERLSVILAKAVKELEGVK